MEPSHQIALGKKRSPNQVTIVRSDRTLIQDTDAPGNYCAIRGARVMIDKIFGDSRLASISSLQGNIGAPIYTSRQEIIHYE
jgi:hypothetical protein